MSKALWIRTGAHDVDSVLVAQLAVALNVKPVTAYGHLLAFSGGVAEHTDAGLLRDVPDATIESWARWDGRRGRFAAVVRQLIQDDSGEFRGWRETHGKLIERRAADRQRKATTSKNTDGDSAGDSTETTRTYDGNSAESRRNSAATERKTTERNVVRSSSTSTTSVSASPSEAELPEAAGVFVRDFYGNATPERQADVLAQLRATLTPAGAKIKGSERARAVDARHLARCLASIIRERRPDKPDVAIHWALREIAETRLEYDSEQAKQSHTGREGSGVAHISAPLQAVAGMRS